MANPQNEWVAALGVAPEKFDLPATPAPGNGKKAGGDDVQLSSPSARENGAMASTNSPRIASPAAGAGKVPAFSGTKESQRLRSALTVIENIKQVGSNIYELTVGGKTLHLTEADVKTATSKIRNAMQTCQAQIRTKAAGALTGYLEQSKIDRATLGSLAVSGVVKVFGHIGDPGKQIKEQALAVIKNIESSKKELDQGRFVAAGDLLAMAEYHARVAEKMYSDYHNHIISSGEARIEKLEWTEKAAVVALAIGAAIITAGASLGATSLAGVELGAASAANGIAIATPLAEEVAQAGAKIAFDEKVDWGQLAVDVVVTAIVVKFAPHLAKGIAAKLVGKIPAAASLGRKAVASIVSGLLTGRGAAAFGAAANTAYQKYRGKVVTWGTLVNHTINAVLDPKSSALDLILSAIGAAGVARGKPLGGPSAPETPQPAVPAKTAAPSPPTVKPPIEMPPAQVTKPSTPPPVPNEPVTASKTEGSPIRGVIQGGGVGDKVPRGNLKAVGEGGGLIEPKAARPAKRAESVPQQEQQPREESAELEQVQEQQFQKAAGDREFAAPRPAMTKTGPATEASGGPRRTNGPVAPAKVQAGGSSIGGAVRVEQAGQTPPRGSNMAAQGSETPRSKGPATPQDNAVSAEPGTPKGAKPLSNLSEVWELKGMDQIRRRMEKANFTFNALGLKTQQALLDFINKDPATAAKRLGKELDIKEVHAQEVERGAGKNDKLDVPAQTIEPNDPVTRERVLGKTPTRDSDTGKAVIERMKSENRISEDGKLFRARDGKWYEVAKADMGHYPVDAVTWWNKIGRLHGERSNFVLAWMKNPRHYELEPSAANRSAGGKLRAQMRGQGLSYSEPHPEPMDPAKFPEEAEKLKSRPK
jgi:hypothetical protein